MYNRINILRKITKNKKFSIYINNPFNNLAINFISEFSNELRKNSKNKNLDLDYLSLWCSKKKIIKLKKEIYVSELRFGRGLIFHICPSNVPTNFIYSFFFGLLSGNSNIVKIPSKNFYEKEVILKTLNVLMNKKRYIRIKNSNFFLNINKNDNLSDEVSSICDGRLIWGGDNTINEFRKKWIPERSIDLTFSDRYSISLIDVNKFKKLNLINKKKIVRNFFYDTYLMNQLACNSPHFVFWTGKKDLQTCNLFWNELYDFSKSHFMLNEKLSINKYLKMIKNIIEYKFFDNIKRFDNNLYVIDINKKIFEIENIRGLAGTFFQTNIKKVDDLKRYITKKCQTVTYFGLKKENFEKLILENNVIGIDRIVPIGKSFDITQNWDGYDIISTLSRIVNYE